MKLHVLGCSGAIGGPQRRTTTLQVGETILIDAGTGVGDLDLEALATIDHVFLTHAHFDHIAMLPLMLDAVGELRTRPVTVYATAPTRSVLEQHVFNWAIWPDFTTIPTPEAPYLRFETLQLGQTVAIEGVAITVLPAEHTVPAVGYQIDSGVSSILFTGDTTVNDAFWRIANRIDNLRYLIIETAFADDDQALAITSRHLCPQMLASELAKLERDVEIHITHLKPAQAERIMQEIAQQVPHRRPVRLENGRIFTF